ncbi:hypothetical protein BN946_scf185010.g48 [Trametes cinnabarina]|uniref:Major facilitator superfamily (MFS) profile domain-containing protein n=1 Tax=Pycnoporus cinnabarinus TaxID=5643 RepID=A0A060SRM8_PYCCI|nr:hypothetical protein BN946_scf185010.g48 [Trametes cinnabarina]
MPPNPTSQSGAPPTKPVKASKGSAFWLSFLAIVVCGILSVLDTTAVSTMLPTITRDLNGDNDFVWVGAAYGLASTAMLPFCGRLADVFGRRPIMLLSVAFFFVGSALSGAAQNMNMLIAARTIQGVGGGGIQNMSSIITSDLVPLVERGAYQGIIVLAWALGAAVGPVIATESTFVGWLLGPEGVMAMALFAHVLAPLIIGVILILGFFVYEALVPSEPTLPFDILKNRTSLGGYLATFFHGIISVAAIYYFPVYFQACLLASPIGSSVKILPTAAVSSFFSLLGGITVKKMNKYRLPNYLGWILIAVGAGILTTLKADSSVGQWAGYQALHAAGSGLMWVVTVFPILAPLPLSRAAPALAFYSFLRTFAQTWGVTIGATVLQNELKRRLPTTFLQQFPDGVEIAYAVIPLIPELQEPLRTEVRVAFAESISTIWKVLTGISVAGCLTTLLLREIPMQTYTDDKFGLERQQEQQNNGEGRIEEGPIDEDAKNATVDRVELGSITGASASFKSTT